MDGLVGSKIEDRAASRVCNASFDTRSRFRSKCSDVGRWSAMVGGLIDGVRRGMHGYTTRGRHDESDEGWRLVFVSIETCKK